MIPEVGFEESRLSGGRRNRCRFQDSSLQEFPGGTHKHTETCKGNRGEGIFQANEQQHHYLRLQSLGRQSDRERDKE